MSVNLHLQDLDIRHQIGLSRYSAATAAKIVALLNRTETDIVDQIQAAGWDEVSRQSAKVGRLEKLLEGIRVAQTEAYAAATKTLRTDLVELSEYEVEFQAGAIATAAKAVEVPVAIGQLAKPTAEMLKAAVDSRPFQGRLLKEWGKDLDSAAFRRVRDAVRIGYVEGESVQQIVTRIRGTKAARFKDGITEISRRDAEGLVRTAVTHTANASKDAFFRENSDVFRGVRWNAVLDGRTTAVCRGRDGQVFPLESGPRPPAHWRCRSTTTAVLKGEPDAPTGETYGDWLKRQDSDLQEDILGKTKAKLFRDGGLPLDRFVDRAGAEYTLDELRRREAAAFQKAGVGAPADPPKPPPAKSTTPAPKPKPVEAPPPPPVKPPAPEKPPAPKPKPAAPPRDDAALDRALGFGSEVGDKFKTAMRDAYVQVPDGVRRTLDKAGMKITSPRMVVDHNAALRTQQPRGYAPGATFENVDGIYDPARKTLVVAEKSRSRFTGKISDTLLPGQTLHHEIGHAFDAALGRPSQMDAFQAAYDADVAAFMRSSGGNPQKLFSYYLQPGFAGRSEMFAEQFAVSLRPDSVDHPLSKNFPRSAQLVRGLSGKQA